MTTISEALSDHYGKLFLQERCELQDHPSFGNEMLPEVQSPEQWQKGRKRSFECQEHNTNATKRNGGQVLKEKKRHTAATLKWLQENYCLCSGVCLPRENVYEHYVHFCRKGNLEPACKATFGKIIKQVFPGVTSKRLGARGHSKYHYHGIAIKENSEYYHTVYSEGLTRFSGCKTKSEGGFTRKYSLSSRTGTLLPEFPEASTLKIPDRGISSSKVQIFLTMYKTHCQCILDTAISGNFEEIRSFLLHFWQGLPEHLLPLVKQQMINDVISICDWILYKTLNDVLIPSTMQEMSEKLLCDIHNLAQNWESWLTSSLENLPECLAATKLPLARLFARTLKRHVVFIHLTQTARPVLYDAKLVRNMMHDVENVELNSDTFTSISKADDSDIQLGAKFLGEFQEQLRKQAVVEGLIEWLDEVVQQKIIKPSKQTGKCFKKQAQEFLLQWSYFGARIVCNLTLGNASSFASFHLIHLLMEEYLHLAIESQFLKEKEAELELVLQKYLKDTGNNSLKRLCNPPSSCFLVNRHQNGTSSSDSEFTDRSFQSRRKRSSLAETQNTTAEMKVSSVPLVNNSILTPPLSPGSNNKPMYPDCMHEIPAESGGRTELNYCERQWNPMRDEYVFPTTDPWKHQNLSYSYSDFPPVLRTSDSIPQKMASNINWSSHHQAIENIEVGQPVNYNPPSLNDYPSRNAQHFDMTGLNGRGHVGYQQISANAMNTMNNITEYENHVPSESNFDMHSLNMMNPGSSNVCFSAATTENYLPTTHQDYFYSTILPSSDFVNFGSEFIPAT